MVISRLLRAEARVSRSCIIRPIIRWYSAAKSEEVETLVVLSRNLYEKNEPIYINPLPAKPSFYNKSILEAAARNDKSVLEMKHLQLHQVLQGDHKELEKRLTGRTDKLQAIIGNEFKLLPKEAIVILCGLSNSLVQLGLYGTDSANKIMFESSKLKDIGESTYRFTKQTLLLFGDLQYLSAPWEELLKALRAVNDEAFIIPEFMKANLIYDLVIPFRGTTRGFAHLVDSELSEDITQLAARQRRIKDATSIGSFYTMIGLLVIKYGKERIVENFLVPNVFNGKNGIIQIITDRIGEK